MRGYYRFALLVSYLTSPKVFPSLYRFLLNPKISSYEENMEFHPHHQGNHENNPLSHFPCPFINRPNHIETLTTNLRLLEWA